MMEGWQPLWKLPTDSKKRTSAEIFRYYYAVDLSLVEDPGVTRENTRNQCSCRKAPIAIICARVEEA